MGGRIVVGVDGSEHSRQALQHAFEEARRRGASVDVVHAYQVPIYWDPAGYGVPMPTLTLDEVQREAHEVIDRCVPDDLPDDLQVKRIVTHGPPAQALMELAEGADLLVVGSRGLGGFRGLLLGSTSHQLATHAPCPVLIVRTPEDSRASRDAA